MNLDLDRRIGVALTGASTCADIAALTAEVEAALVTAIDSVERERIKAYDPTVGVQEARLSLADAEFARDRMQAALAVLRARLRELQAQERSEQWHREYARVEAERDALAAEFRELYPASVSKIIDLLARKTACDTKISRINGSAPADVSLRMREVELVARNLQSFAQDRPPISKELRLPDWDQSNKLAWPLPQTPLGALVAQGMAAVDHPGGVWRRQREERLRKLQVK